MLKTIQYHIEGNPNVLLGEVENLILGMYICLKTQSESLQIAQFKTVFHSYSFICHL